MIRIYHVGKEKIKTDYAVDGEPFLEIGNSSKALIIAKNFVDKNKKVLLIDREEMPGISSFALLEVIDIDKIVKGEKYTSIDGFDVIWDPGENYYDRNGYYCTINIQKLKD